jgi:hypothetical protein
MEQTTSMTTCMSAYFWLVAVACVVKTFGVNPMMVDGIFFVAVLGTMFLIYSAVMRERCGDIALGPLLSATLVPWTVMLGGTMIVLYFLPGWKQPFSNTFGYMVVLFPKIQATNKLVKMFADSQKSSIKLIQDNPSLMLNEFAGSTFAATIAKLKGEGLVGDDAAAIADFQKVVYIKDAVAEFVWYMLVGCVAITTSFNLIMNHTCQKSTMNVAPLVPVVPDLTGYVVED